jgi:MYXO-CTERM domain-containing protein
MWYEAAPGGNKSFTAYATSSDGIAWTRYPNNPVMSPSEPWEGGANNPEGEASPVSVLREKGKYRLYYHGYTGNGVRQIGLAESADGITWTKSPQNPILTPGDPGSWDADSVCEPKVLHVGATYFMFYSHCVGTGGIGLATSADGIAWTKAAGNPVIAVGSGWDSAQVDWGDVYYDGTTFHMWYPGHADFGGFSLGYASSTDGMTWTKSPNNPVYVPLDPTQTSTDYAVNKGDALGVENRPTVLRLGSDWWIYYGGLAHCCPEDATLCLAKAPVQSAPNAAPMVDAGANQAIASGAKASLDGTVMDDDVPVPLAQVTTTWSVKCGPGQATFDDAAAIDTKASFSEDGTYVLELTANDGKLAGSATVEIVVGAGSNDCASGGAGSTSSATSTASGAISTAASSSSAATGQSATSGSSNGASTVSSSSSGNGAAGAGGAGPSSPSGEGGGGCGCRAAGTPSEGLAAALAMLAALGLLRRRR